MKLGVIGLPHCGKTTVFNALTGRRLPTGMSGASGKLEAVTAAVDVPDPRVDRLREMYRPRKTTRATVAFTDIGGLEEGIGASGVPGPLRNELVRVDGFVHVVRLFEDPALPHPYGDLDPARDVTRLDSELVLLDLLTVEHRSRRLREDWPRTRAEARTQNERESTLMERLRDALEQGRSLREVALAPSEEKAVRGFGLLSRKPTLVLANVADDAVPEPPAALAARSGTAVAALRGRVEADVAGLDPDERAHFLDAYGIAEPGAARVIRIAYGLIGLHSVFTVGEDEVRAWTVHVGATALEAAGVIHSDLARGFIRVEVTRYADLVAAGGPKAVRAGGLQRLESRDYVVRDGDILSVRAST